MPKPEIITVRCMVTGVNSDGDRDIHFVKVRATREQVARDKHYAAAMAAAAEAGYDRPFAFDEFDPAGVAILDKFVWSTASTVDAAA